MQPPNRELNRNYFCSRIETSNVVRVGGDYALSSRSGAEHDRCVDHICRSADTAKLTAIARTLVVERFDLCFRGSKQPGQPDLPSSIPPNLPDHAGRYGDRLVMCQRASDQSHDTSVIAFEGYEGPGVERQAGHAQRWFRRFVVTPSSRSAARISLALNGPPDSASISSSSAAKSSSFTFSSSADATYALTLAARPRRTACRARCARCFGRLTAIFSETFIPAV